VEIVNFVPPLWSSVPDVLTGVALKLPTHRLVRIDVGERLKKVWRPSPYCGGSYGRWRDRSMGSPWSHRAFCVVVVCCERTEEHYNH
jgi:hypothetical protein